jgi:hypothetical protein
MADHADDGGNDNDVFVYMGGNQEVPHNVRYVRVHKSVKIIPFRAFCDCKHLVSIEMHDGVEIIEKEAFNDCYNLREINLSGVRVIKRGAFWGCRALEDVEFGNKLDTIGFEAFRSTALRNVKLTKVRIIETCAFWGCRQLTEVELLSKDLEGIGGAALAYCPRLRRVAMPLKDNLLGNNYVFSVCKELSVVDLVGGIHKTVSSLLLESWRNEMNDEIDRINQVLPSFEPNELAQSHNPPADEKTVAIRRWMETVIRRIEHYKSEHHTLLKEAMALLELALWKAKLDDYVVDDAAAQEGVRVTRRQRKRARKDRCITSGASVVIKNVLPFLKLE